MGQSPGWDFRKVPTPAEWNGAFAAKQDDLGLSLATTEALVAGVGVSGGIPVVLKGQFTLPSGVTSYTVMSSILGIAGNCIPTSFVLLLPQTPDAALQQIFAFAVAGQGQFVVTCANSPKNDMLFNVLMIV